MNSETCPRNLKAKHAHCQVKLLLFQGLPATESTTELVSEMNAPASKVLQGKLKVGEVSLRRKSAYTALNLNPSNTCSNLIWPRRTRRDSVSIATVLSTMRSRKAKRQWKKITFIFTKTTLDLTLLLMQEQQQTLYKSSSNFQFLLELNTPVSTCNVPFLAVRKKKAS